MTPSSWWINGDPMTRTVLLLLLAATLALPFILRPKRPAMAQAGDALVIITPHNEAIRHEFGLAFQRWYREHTGRTVSVDWRVIGGTGEIIRHLNGAYTASFQDYWTHTLRREWSLAVEAGFDDARVQPAEKPGQDTPAQAARRAFLESDAGCGIDLFFGGGPHDFAQQAGAGHLVNSGVLQRHPECFTDEAIPRFFAGEEYWDPRGRWVGTVLSNYGILSNRESLARLGVASAPRAWTDLKDPRLQGEVALADPTRSSSMAKAFENVIQEHMQERLLSLMVAADQIASLDENAVEAQAVHEGWIAGLQFLQLAGANARYFTDSAQKVPVDVADGNCAAGMCIDFYGRQEQEAERRRGGGDRLVFVAPAGGTIASVDPVALLRGARNRQVALAFIDWVVSLDAQKLWAFRPGTPGGPSFTTCGGCPCGATSTPARTGSRSATTRRCLRLKTSTSSSTTRSGPTDCSASSRSSSASCARTRIRSLPGHGARSLRRDNLRRPWRCSRTCRPSTTTMRRAGSGGCSARRTGSMKSCWRGSWRGSSGINIVGRRNSRKPGNETRRAARPARGAAADRGIRRRWRRPGGAEAPLTSSPKNRGRIRRDRRPRRTMCR